VTLGADKGYDTQEFVATARFDERPPLPIANDPRFHLELYRAVGVARGTLRPDEGLVEHTEEQA
jgi:hypothetical protein